MKPISLPPNQPRDRFYSGGAAIAAFRNSAPALPNTPEDWIASTTTVRGQTSAGLTVLPDGTLLAERILSDPLSWLGRDHVASYGSDANLLVKLLDAGQRLPVHAHPDDGFAAAHLGASHGKAEAWYILSPGVVHVGLKEDISTDELEMLVESQAIETLLAQMHTVEVASGDTVFVPPGLLHAIGAGILLVEVQQPEDLSILLEWRGFDLDGAHDGHLGLGFSTALGAIETTARTTAEIQQLVRAAPGPGSVLPEASAAFFRLNEIQVLGQTHLPAGYGVVVVLDGRITFRVAAGDVPAAAGSTLLIPAAAGPVQIIGSGRLLHCRPPASAELS